LVPLITSPLIFRICLFTIPMAAMKISSSVMDLSTGASLVQGPNKDNIYEWPSASRMTQPTVHSSVAAPVDVWHRRLGHPSPFIQQKLLSCHSLPLFKSPNSMMHCDACLSNKSHRQPFGSSSISSSKPFEIIYTDV
ncbi:unnamed protein product, partial [Musa hybrid cultivar]